jgi:hypothetical protein
VATEFSNFDFGFLRNLPLPLSQAGKAHLKPHPEAWHTCRIEFTDSVDLAGLQAALVRLPDSIQRIKGFVAERGLVWAVQQVGKSVNVTKMVRPVEAAVVGTLVVVASESPVRALRQALISVPGARVIEDESCETTS